MIIFPPPHFNIYYLLSCKKYRLIMRKISFLHEEIKKKLISLEKIS